MRLSHAVAIVGWVGLISATSPLNPRHASARATDSNTSTRIVIGSTTKALQILVGQTSGYPGSWYYNRFDDSQWGHPAAVSPAVASCITQTMDGWAGFPAYWGTGNLSSLLLRQHFYLLKVPGDYGYAGTTIDLRSYARDTDVWLNQQPILVADSNDFSGVSPGVLSLRAFSTADRIPVGSLIHAGDNVLALRLDASTDTHTPAGAPCNATGFIITTQSHSATDGASPSPSPIPAATAVPTAGQSGPSVSPSFPADNAIVTGTALPLSWQPFRQAAAYLVRVWLVKADAGQAVTASTVATTTQTVLGARTAISTARMLKGQYRWDVAALDAAGQLITAWSAPRRLQLA